MEWVIFVIGAVVLVLGFVLGPYLRRHAQEAGRETRKRLTGSTEPSTTGTYVGAGLFAAFGVYMIIFRTTDVTKGIPGWLSGAVLVACGVGLAVTVSVRRWRHGAPPSTRRHRQNQPEP